MGHSSVSLEACNAHLLEGLIEATTPAQETAEDKGGRTRTIIALFRDFAPATAVESMLACQCIGLRLVWLGAMRALSASEGDATARARLQASVNALSKTMHTWYASFRKAKAEARAAAKAEAGAAAWSIAPAPPASPEPLAPETRDPRTPAPRDARRDAPRSASAAPVPPSATPALVPASAALVAAGPAADATPIPDSDGSFRKTMPVSAGAMAAVALLLPATGSVSDRNLVTDVAPAPASSVARTLVAMPAVAMPMVAMPVVAMSA